MGTDDHFVFWLPYSSLGLLFYSFMNGVLLAPLQTQGIAFYLQHVKRMRLCLKVLNSQLMCLRLALQLLLRWHCDGGKLFLIKSAFSVFVYIFYICSKNGSTWDVLLESFC